MIISHSQAMRIVLILRAFLCTQCTQIVQMDKQTNKQANEGGGLKNVNNDIVQSYKNQKKNM